MFLYFIKLFSLIPKKGGKKICNGLQIYLSHHLLVLLTLVVMSFSLISCNSGGVGTSTTASASPYGSNGGLSLPQISTLQVTGTTPTRKLFLPIKNTSNIAINLNSYTISVIGAMESNISSCKEIPADSTCIAEIIVPNSFKYVGKGNFILTIYATDVYGHQYKSNTIINYDKINEILPLNMESAINYTLNNNGNDYLVIPAILSSAISKPIVTLDNKNHNTQIFCDKTTDYQYCSIVVNMVGVDISNKTILALSDSNSEILTSNISAYNPYFAGNLVATGFPAIISPSNGTTKLTITLVNNGNAPLTLSSESAVSPIAIESNTCGTIKLESSSTCSFKLSANSQINGTANVTVSYVTMGQARVLTFPVSYYRNYLSIGASVSTSANLIGVVKSTVVPALVTIVNNSNVALTYLGIGNLSAQSSSFTESSGYSAANKCIKSGSVAAGASCTLQINYAPTVGGQGGILVIAPIFAYIGANGESLTYAGTSTKIQFSSSSNYYFYFGSLNSANESSAYKCQFNPTSGALSNCSLQRSVGKPATLVQSFVQYNDTNIFASNAFGTPGPNSISSCIITPSTGNLSCTSLSTGSVTLTWPVGMAVNNGYLYVVNRIDGESQIPQLMKCNYSSTSGALSNCVGYLPTAISGMTLNGPYGIAIYNNVAYITTKTNIVYACQISSSDGSLSGCTSLNIVVTSGYSPGSPLDSSHAIVINNGLMYVSSFTVAAVTVCKINEWSSCYRFRNTSLLADQGILGLAIYGNYLFASSQSTANPVRFTLQSDGYFYTSTAESQTGLSSFAQITGMLGLGLN